MAQALTKANDDPASGRVGDLIKSMVIANLLGGAGGAAFGYLAIPTHEPVPPLAKEESPAAKTAPLAPAPGRFPSDAREIPIPPIIVDLKGEPASRVRIDLSIIAVHGTAETGVLKEEVREDVIAYLKGLTIADIQGARGFQNLREQLDDRAKIRGRGAILGILIGGFLVQ
jgi:flagellar FliL protein